MRSLRSESSKHRSADRPNTPDHLVQDADEHIQVLPGGQPLVEEAGTDKMVMRRKNLIPDGVLVEHIPIVDCLRSVGDAGLFAVLHRDLVCAKAGRFDAVKAAQTVRLRRNAKLREVVNAALFWLPTTGS